MRTLPVGLVTTRGSAFDFGMIMAGATFAAIPVVIVFLLFQQYFEKGLTVGAIKG
jgi:multiple sugar transport system permease protein